MYELLDDLFAKPFDAKAFFGYKMYDFFFFNCKAFWVCTIESSTFTFLFVQGAGKSTLIPSVRPDRDQIALDQGVDPQPDD